MHRNPLRTSTLAATSATIMGLGAVLYLVDQIQTPRNWHLLLAPSLVLMALGALLALVNVYAKRV